MSASSVSYCSSSCCLDGSGDGDFAVLGDSGAVGKGADLVFKMDFGY